MNSKYTRRWSSVASVLLGFVLSVTSMTVAQAQDRSAARGDGTVPAYITARKLDAPIQAELAGGKDLLFKMAPSLRNSAGRNQVIVRLQSPAAAEYDGDSPGARMSRKVNIQSEQAALISRLRAKAPDLKVIAQTQLVLNAVFIEVDAAFLPALAEDAAVTRVAPIGDYEIDLSETVPYIGAAAVQAAGVDGSGVKVAILDSGIDYTHANMGGAGTLEAYLAAHGGDPFNPLSATRDGLFPTEKVVDGYDFVGELWPFDDLAPDDDPIDYQGHGSHVADITAGENGVAPGADLYAVKVCSAVATSCSGVALIQGMEFAVDPNGDGDPSDRVDIINMSLGSTYGLAFDDDLSAAVDNASSLGVLTVSSAGNCGDRPWCTGTPSSAPTALSVAQTQVPSAFLPFITVDGIDYPSVFQSWSTPAAGVLSDPVQYADGAGGNLNGCAPYADSLAGKVVLVDRGACNFTLKIKNISDAGGTAGIIGLVAAGAPFSGGDGGDRPINIPGYMISQADSNAIKGQIGGPGIATIDPDNALSLAGWTVSSTARGPELSFVNLKPEIGAPGASVSLEVGSGTGETPFGGTSGASPMVAGSAALVQDACRDDDDDSDSDRNHGRDDGCSPLELKALLMNTAYRDIVSETTGELAEVTRIGGGEVRAEAAVNAPFWAYSRDDDNPSISLGVIDAARDMTIKRKVRIENLSGKRQKIKVSNEDRLAAGAATNAIDVDTRSTVNLGNEGKAMLNVKFHVDASEANDNAMNSGTSIADPATLGVNEVAGYLKMNSKDGEISVPWHAIVRKAADVDPDRQTIVPGGFPDSIGLQNDGVGTAQNDAYTIIGLSDEMPRGAKGAQSPTPDLRAVGVTTIPVPAGFCSADESFLWVFAFNTWDRQSSLIPVIFEIDLDIDQDGIVDYEVYNAPLSIITAGDFSDPRELTWAFDTSTGLGGAFFFTEHATNTANTSLTICAEQVGLGGADILATNVDAEAYAFDFYFGGPGDFIDDITITPLGEGYFGVPTFGGLPFEDIPGGLNGTLDVYDYGLWPGNTPEAGVMLFTNGDRSGPFNGGATEDTEALLFLAPGVDAPEPLPKGKMHKKDHDDDSD